MPKAFDELYYAQCWEDPLMNQAALEINPGEVVLGICSAGDNVLAHLLDDPALVVAVDFNPVQLRLARLKVAAIRTFDRQTFLAFAGFIPHPDRDSLFRQLQELISAEDMEFWQQHMEMIRQGCIHQGKFERFFSLFRRRILPLMHNRKKVDRLLSEKTDTQQRHFYNRHWDTWRWRLLFRLFFNRVVISRSGRSEAHFAHVENGNISSVFRERAQRVLEGQQPWNNPFLQYIFRGCYPHETCLPEYIKPENYEIIRNRLDRLEFRQGDLGEILDEWQYQPVDAWNLSDIFEYLPEGTVKNLGEKIHRTSADKARLSYWNLLVPRQLSTLLPHRFHYRKELARRLWQRDRAFVYGDYIAEFVTK